MKIAVTGAAGFLGRYVVAELLRRGHAVVAIVRPGSAPTPWAPHPRLEVARHDLADADGAGELAGTLAGCDAVAHLAGKASDSAEAAAVVTGRVLAAIDAAGVSRLVAVGSFSVYDFAAIPAGGTLDEASALETHPERRDAYARAKLVQERLVRGHAEACGWGLIVLRPGAIYGPGRLWTARLGHQLFGGRLWVMIGGGARVPLTYVENCAGAVVRAAEHAATSAPGELILNVVDDDPPTQSQYAALIRLRLTRRPPQVALPRVAVRALAAVVSRVAGRRAPGLLVPERFDARLKPLEYPNARIQAALGWRARYGLEEALARCDRPEPELLAIGVGSGLA